MFVFSVPEEPPPPPSGVFFGRDEWIEKIVGFAEHHSSIALIGAGGIANNYPATSIHGD